ncbi:MAG TPA: phospholipase D-like domain-containing protein [Candidatus Saccharimonadales bacterium]|nr:phospholipase D-like domain-containing protein [Candidatus Saccharimonadales bacterium]
MADTSIPMRLVMGDRYYQELLTKIPRAQKRIVLAAMNVLSGPQTDRVFHLLQEAAERGVPVQVLVDNYTRLLFIHPPSADRSARLRVQHTFEALTRLEQADASVYYFGKVRVLNPFKGRCHVKITVIDDDFYSFGGVNFTDESFKHVDFMLGGHHAGVAKRLAQLVERIGTIQPPLPDDDIAVSATQHLLFDGGGPGDSIIYEQACELAAQAQRSYYVSQMVPSGQLAHLLSEAGGQTTCYFNQPHQMRAPARYGQAFDQQRHRIRNSYHGQHFIHAKFMLFELPGGHKALISGSNNFSYRGIAYGTQEVALYSTDEDLWQQLFDFLQRHVAKER